MRAYSEGGDSGAPVIIPSLVNGTASLFGINWGRYYIRGQGWFFVYSPIFNVLNELGPLYTFEGGGLPG